MFFIKFRRVFLNANNFLKNMNIFSKKNQQFFKYWKKGTCFELVNKTGKNRTGTF